MPYNISSVSKTEKAASILSYFTMGITGLIWILAAYFLKKKIKFFLMYNMLQSLLAAVILAAFNYAAAIIIQILSAVPFLSGAGMFLSSVFQYRIPFFALSFNIKELFVIILLIYISSGILLGRIFYIPLLTNVMKKIMYKYR